MVRLEADIGAVFVPAVVRVDQHHGGFVAVFGLTGHVADGLVQQDRDQLRLGRVGSGQDLNVRGRIDARAERIDNLAVDEDPAFFDSLVRFAARAEAEFGHYLGQAHEAVFVVVRFVGVQRCAV